MLTGRCSASPTGPGSPGKQREQGDVSLEGLSSDLQDLRANKTPFALGEGVGRALLAGLLRLILELWVLGEELTLFLQ